MKPTNRNRGMTGTLPVLATAMLALAATDIVSADDELLPGETILDRNKPQYDPQGIPVGSFRLFPSAGVTATYDSNIYALALDEVHDWITIFSPRLDLVSNWGRHALEISTSARIAKYQVHDDEDFVDSNLRANLRFDLAQENRIALTAQVSDKHDGRDSPDDVAGIEPTTFELSKIEAEYTYRGSHIQIRLTGGEDTFSFDDVRGSAGIINNQDRNRTLSITDLRIGYEINPRLDILLRARADKTDYDFDLDDGGINRDSDSRAIGVGLQGSLTGALYADLLVGQVERDYDDVSLERLDTLWLDSRIIWNVSRLTSLTLRANRDIRETTLANASGFVSTIFGLRADHELRRNFLMYAGVSGGTHDFDGIDRKDDVYNFEFGVRYLVNRNFQIEFKLVRRERDSGSADGATDDFVKNAAFLTAKVQK